ncbi:MAG TPA: hypothetical protein VEL70_03235 [Candidatus Acidoferrum sp.]|nr:hypothetical protein [Candidatus Acidoferrum sp.]
MLPVTDSMTCIIRVCHVTHISVMSTGKHTIPAKRATIFNPEITLISSVSITRILLSEITSYLQEQQTTQIFYFIFLLIGIAK